MHILKACKLRTGSTQHAIFAKALNCGYNSIREGRMRNEEREKEKEKIPSFFSLLALGLCTKGNFMTAPLDTERNIMEASRKEKKTIKRKRRSRN